MYAALGIRNHEKVTLEIGSAIVLSAVAFGAEVGHWSGWTIVAWIAGYLVWVVAYAEATIRVRR